MRFQLLWALLILLGVCSALPSAPVNETALPHAIEPQSKVSLQIGQSCRNSPGDKELVEQAWSDALMIAAAVRDPNFNGWLERQYYGVIHPEDSIPPDTYYQHILDSFNRFLNADLHTGVGDWWYERYVNFECGNEVDIGLGDGVRSRCAAKDNAVGAHTVDRPMNPPLWGVKTRYYTIVLCDKWFDLPTTTRAIELVEEPGSQSQRDNVKTLISQGTSMLHEMHHLEFVAETNEEGFTNPRNKDVSYDGARAYGAGRAKFLAKQQGLGVAHLNVDNNVYYAVARWMTNRWGKDVKFPDLGWAGTRYPQVADGMPDDTAPTYTVADYDIVDYFGHAEFEIEPLPDISNPADYVEVDDYDFYGGNPCSTETDCEGVCVPGVYTYCHDTEMVCRCGFRFDPGRLAGNFSTGT